VTTRINAKSSLASHKVIPVPFSEHVTKTKSFSLFYAVRVASRCASQSWPQESYREKTTSNANAYRNSRMLIGSNPRVGRWWRPLADVFTRCL
jgi:hypothetical protein